MNGAYRLDDRVPGDTPAFINLAGDVTIRRLKSAQWVIRSQVILYTVGEAGSTDATGSSLGPPQHGWQAEAGVKMPTPSVDCSSAPAQTSGGSSAAIRKEEL